MILNNRRCHNLKEESNYTIGLNNDEVLIRAEQGKINGISKSVTKSYKEIIKDNVCTLFNLLNFLIFIALFLVRAWSNLIFMAIIAANALIGIYQEIKAKKLIDHLSLLTKPTITVIRDGKQVIIDISEVVIDDILVLESGNQICNDAVVIQGKIEVDESLLTGESDPINKYIDSALLSGSTVISGKCYAKVVKTGDDNYATMLVKKAQMVKEKHSELMDSMKKVTKLTTFLIIPLGIILFVEAYYLRQDTLFNAVVASAAGLLGMLPKGLVLLTSVSLANGGVRLAKRNVLIQDLYSLETLSHVDVLCLDKTGTITNGKMKVEKTVILNAIPNLDINEIIGSYLQVSDDNNATFQALENHFKKNNKYKCVNKISFSSLRKWSSIEFEDLGTIVVGAIEKIVLNIPEEINALMSQGMRAIAVGHTNEDVSDKKDLPKLNALMVIILSDMIRENTKETLHYFYQEGVEIKVISGDNIDTVTAIARDAGVINWQYSIDMSTVHDEEIQQVVKDHTVFGRVTPAQKQLIISALKQNGHQVAMTGDGVNDLLALKEADCSIAIADGSDASKQISQVVLLNSDFTCLLDVLLEGRKVVNNVTRVSGVFFIKTIYTILLSLFCAISNIGFPFIPLQITLIDLLIEAMPSFMTIFESDTCKIKGKFLPTALGNAASSAISITVLFITILLSSSLLCLNQLETVTVMYLILGIISMAAVIRSCFPFTKLRILICTMMISGFCGAVLLFPELLHLSPLTPKLVLMGVTGSIIGLIIERIIHWSISKKYVN